MEKGDERTYAIVGAAMEVHRQLGNGFLEAIYHEALRLEFSIRNIPYRDEVDLVVLYKGQQLQATYRADFVCFDSIVVELKALARLSSSEESQVINYLKQRGLKSAYCSTSEPPHSSIADLFFRNRRNLRNLRISALSKLRSSVRPSPLSGVAIARRIRPIPLSAPARGRTAARADATAHRRGTRTK